jgi:hypothetical protein
MILTVFDTRRRSKMLSRFIQELPFDGLMKMVYLKNVAFTKNPGHEYNLPPKRLNMADF